jgi:flagellar motor switch protein FliG
MSNDTGVDDSAILLLSLGEEEAAEVFKFLSPKEAQKLGAAMAALKNVTREKIDEVAEKFNTEAAGQTSIGLDSDEYIRGVLNRALGEEKAKFVLDRILSGGDTSGIESLKWMDAPTVAELIKNEHPQIIASILVHLERDQAAGILNLFPDRVRGDVVMRIATLDGIHPNALRELNETIAKVLSGSDQIKKAALGGVRTDQVLPSLLLKRVPALPTTTKALVPISCPVASGSTPKLALRRSTPLKSVPATGVATGVQVIASGLFSIVPAAPTASHKPLLIVL